MAPSAHTVNDTLFGNLPYDSLRDFTPVGGIGTTPLLLSVHPSLPVRSVKELIILARARPGELNCGTSGNGSGDIFIAFATGNRGLPGGEEKTALLTPCHMVVNERITPLFEACAEATEEAILNAMCMATTTVGIHGRTIHALPLERVRELVAT